MAPRFSSGKISIWCFSKWILGSYKTQTVNFKPMLCRYIHSNMLKTLMFFNIIMKKKSENSKMIIRNYVTPPKIQWKQLQMMGFMMLNKSCSYLIWSWKYLHLKFAEVTKNHLVLVTVTFIFQNVLSFESYEGIIKSKSIQFSMNFHNYWQQFSQLWFNHFLNLEFSFWNCS